MFQKDSPIDILPDEHAAHFFKFCPHCGSSTFSAVSPKEFICKKCGFNFFPNSAAAIACIVEDTLGRVMLVRRAHNPWKGMLDLPGGFVDPGESAEAALLREMKEELDADVQSYTYLCSSPNKYVFSGYQVQTTDLAFVCRLANADKLLAHDDINGVEWHDVEHLPLEEVPADSIRNILKYYQQTRK